MSIQILGLFKQSLYYFWSISFYFFIAKLHFARTYFRLRMNISKWRLTFIEITRLCSIHSWVACISNNLEVWNCVYRCIKKFALMSWIFWINRKHLHHYIKIFMKWISSKIYKFKDIQYLDFGSFDINTNPFTFIFCNIDDMISVLCVKNFLIIYLLSILIYQRIFEDISIQCSGRFHR